jgi:hypothetical protein
MNPTINKPDRQTFNSPSQQTRRKIAREVMAMYEAILRAAGFEPSERRTAQAITIQLYERAGEDCETPRGVGLAAIGAALTSKSDSEKARTDRARDHVGHLFNHAIPRQRFQIQTRYKAGEESGRPHQYADHLFPVAAFFSEIHAEEAKAILSDKSNTKKAAAIAEARERLAVEALGYLSKCEAEILTPDGAVYARVSEAAAKAYCAKNPEYSARKYEYDPPDPKAKPPRPFYSDDFERIEERIRTEIEKKLDEIVARNSFDEARLFSTRLKTRIEKTFNSWLKIRGDADRGEDKEKRIIHGGENGGVSQSAPDSFLDFEPWEMDLLRGEKLPADPSLTPPKSGGVSDCNSAENNDLQEPFLESVEKDVPQEPVCQESFATSLEAAAFYVRDGWAIVPCCQFNPETDRCTGPESHHRDGICKGKRPLIGAKNPKPGAGYTAASRDMGLIKDWFERQFPAAGVAIRLDDHILIDCDVKNGAKGLESYEILADTFDLPSTLSAVTPSGGRHHIFKLPEDLPADWLGSWTRVADAVGLNDIDLKVGNKGLAHVEPTVGKTGVYRWIDPTAEIATLPRECCDYLHEIHEGQKRAQEEKAKASAASLPSDASTFDPGEDQARYFKDVPKGERRPRLRTIACALARLGADESQIVSVLKYHAGRFSDPVNDPDYIARVSRGALKFAPEVAAQ